MTSVSGVSSTPTAYASATTTANKAMKALLTGSDITNLLAMKVAPGEAPSEKLVTSSLWTFLNGDASGTISKSDVLAALKTVGGAPSDANAVWSLINPGNTNTVSQTQFDNSSYLKGAIQTNLVFIQKGVTQYLTNNPLTAEKTIELLMSSTTVQQALASQSTLWTPPTPGQVFSTIWALFNVNSTKVISKSDVEAGVNAVGGTPMDANALWAQLDPGKNGAVSATQFVNNAYLKDSIMTNLPATRATVSQVLLDSTGKSNSVLDAFSTGGTNILSQAATGYNGSAIGAGDNFNYLNLFV